MAVCLRCASFILFCFLSFHESVAVRRIVDIGNSKICNHCFVLTFGFHFCYTKLAFTFLKHKLQYIMSAFTTGCFGVIIIFFILKIKKVTII